MSGYTELAKLFKDRNNLPIYTPMFGKIVSLPDLKIQCGNRVTLDITDITAMFDIFETVKHDTYIEYVNLNKTVVLLPYSNYQKFIALGVVLEDERYIRI